MVSFVINPGSGPVANATQAHAETNMAAFTEQVRQQVPGAIWGRDRSVKDYGDGRWGFSLTANGRTVPVQMPGIPLERVQYLANANMDPWQFPRLYVDDSSWLWAFALNAAVRCLNYKECPVCEGSGSVQHPHREDDSVDCETCRGTGEIAT